MGILGLVGNSFGCSATGERLVSAARDGDLQEAKALLEYNPRLARYSTFGVRNSPLHYSAAKGHHEIVALLIESGVDINLRNYRGQTALMQACQYGHWEVVQTLILFKANIHRADYLNGGTALHLAALHGHTRCIRLLLADFIPSIPNFLSAFNKTSKKNGYVSVFNEVHCKKSSTELLIGGVTALHMAALNGHAEAVHLLLDVGALASRATLTVGDGSTLDLIGPGSTPLHYAACGGNAQCCQLLIAAGASLVTENGNGWTPLMVAHSWHRDGMEDILREPPRSRPIPSPSPYLCLPLMSIVDIARECGWRNINSPSMFFDPCVVCLERKCTVAAEGCSHEFCTPCALYLCSTSISTTTARGPPGSIACPLCRHSIVSFTKLPGTGLIAKETARTSFSVSFCSFSSELLQTSPLEASSYKSDHNCAARLPSPGSSFRSLSCRKLPSVKLNSSICMGASEISSCLVPRNGDRGFRSQHASFSRPASLQRSTSQNETRRRRLR